MTYRIIWQQAGIVVQDEPAVLPSLHNVGPLAQRPLHDGRHLYQTQTAGRSRGGLEEFGFDPVSEQGVIDSGVMLSVYA